MIIRKYENTGTFREYTQIKHQPTAHGKIWTQPNPIQLTMELTL